MGGLELSVKSNPLFIGGIEVDDPSAIGQEAILEREE